MLAERDFLLHPPRHPWRSVVETPPTTLKRRGSQMMAERGFSLECGHTRRVTGPSAKTVRIGDRYHCYECPKETNARS